MQGTSTGLRRLIAATALVGALGIPAEPAGAARGQSLNLAVGLSTWYDGNLLQYSENQIGQLESGLFPDRFSIEFKDNATFNPSLALTWELDRGGGRRQSLRLKGDGEFNGRNSTADHRSASLTWRETFHGGSRFTARGYYLPSYYLRQLKDVTSGLYERGQFSLMIGGADWSQAFKHGVQAGLGYQLEDRGYSPFFPERTSTTHQGVLSLGFRELPDHGVLNVAAGYRKSRANGADDPGGSASTVPDVSYHGWFADLSGRGEFGRKGNLRITGDFDYKMESRAYESDRPADRSHEGRSDFANILEVGLRAQFRPHWTLRGFDRYDTNHATYGGPAPLTSDPSSYHQNLAGIEIGWSGDLWTQARGGQKPDAEGGD